MEMKKYIEMGEERAGKQIELAKYLNIQSSTLRLVKSGKKSLTNAICIKLARYIEVNEIEVIAASSLIIEKNEERRKIFKSCFKKTSKAASIIIAASVISIMTPHANALNNNTIKNNNLQEYTLLALQCDMSATKNFIKVIISHMVT